nr:YetF domain-containing protein [Paenibacillus sp. 2003]
MNFHEFVTAVIMGAIAANLAFNEKIEVTHLIISLIVFTGTSYLLSKLNLKSRKIRLLAEGSPTVLIEGGKILENNLTKNKLTLDSLNQMLRQKDIFNMEEVEYALLEVNGQVSVMKKINIERLRLRMFVGR